MIEEQAKQKWCPHVRVMEVDADAYAANKNSDGTYDDRHCCIASECMMWRELPCSSENLGTGDITHWTEGYCGLGGKP